MLAVAVLLDVHLTQLHRVLTVALALALFHLQLLPVQLAVSFVLFVPHPSVEVQPLLRHTTLPLLLVAVAAPTLFLDGLHVASLVTLAVALSLFAGLLAVATHHL